MTDEVAIAVLNNNDIHGRQISLDKLRSEKDPLSFSSAIQWVCNRGAMTRHELRLPSDEELLLRQQQGRGLTRPELAVLCANIKMHVFKDMGQGSSNIIPNFSERVNSYFPKEIQKNFISQKILQKK